MFAKRRKYGGTLQPNDKFYINFSQHKKIPFAFLA